MDRLPARRRRTLERASDRVRLVELAGSHGSRSVIARVFDAGPGGPEATRRIGGVPPDLECDDPHMDAAALRACCLGHPGALEEFPFGPETSVFKVAGKMFALTALARTPLEVSAKCEPDLAAQLRATHAAIRPGYHLNKRHWNTITLDGSLPDQLVRDLIEDSYDLVVSALPKRVRDQLGWTPEVGPAGAG